MIAVRRLLLVVAAALLAVAAIPAASVAADTGPAGGLVVPTDRGAVRGQAAGPLRQFLGIPYAAPPVGDLRWQPPQKHAAWPGVLDATQFGSPCPQVGGFAGPGSTDENCLFLNVYTPAHGGHHPVMLWIHGGSLVSGAGSLYGPAQLVAHGVVVVTINYRLGALGFLAHPALTAASPYGGSGDYGMMDQVAALHWTRRNIAEFGGDPGDLTIFGESAGGLSVQTQLASPLAHGLFARAIVQSGAYSLVQPSQAQADAAGAQYAAAVGCASQTAGCLRAVPVATLLVHEAGNYFPNIDGRVLTQSIESALASGTFNRVPLIQGTNHDEWRLFVASAELANGTPLTPAGYEAAILQTLPGIPQAFADQLANVDYPLSAYGGNPSIALGALGTDGIFACNARISLLLASRFVSTFQYEFNDERAPSLLPGISFPQGAEHAVELQYLFSGVGLSPLSPDQQRLSATMTAYWTEFAKKANPNLHKAPAWPGFDPSGERFLSLVPPAPVTATGFAAEHKCSVWGS